MQKFKFPMEALRVTQGENNGYSHSGSLAMDFGGRDTGADKLYCPCDMTVKRTRHNANGELYLESTLPVEFADGTSDYARLLCIHDNAFNVVEGQVLKQGDYFYDEGGMGAGKPNRFGTHVHIEAGKGRWKNCTQSTNAQGTYVIENQSHLYDLFILGDDVEILDDGGYKWKRVSDIITDVKVPCKSCRQLQKENGTLKETIISLQEEIAQLKENAGGGEVIHCEGVQGDKVSGDEILRVNPQNDRGDCGDEILRTSPQNDRVESFWMKILKILFGGE